MIFRCFETLFQPICSDFFLKKNIEQLVFLCWEVLQIRTHKKIVQKLEC